ncbi:TMEM14 family protein [bacterium]|nr:TMEM14 family protein [bacterium]
MIAKKIALGFGIAVVLPMMVHYGVSTFSPRVKWQDYQIENYSQRYKRATPAEKVKLEKEKSQLTKQRKEHEKRFEKHLFFVAAPIGIAAIIVGSVIAVQSIGTGLIFGGIFTLLNGYCWYWSELQDWMRFLSLLVAFVILIFIGYRKFGK